MKKNLKKYLLSFFVGTLVLGSFAFSYHTHVVQACTNSDNSTYCLLAPIPGLTSSTDGSVDVTNGFGDYANRMIRIFIGLLAVMAVIMIVFGGIQYMISDVAGEKSAGKDRIMNAIWGLVLALASYMLLNTINPDFVHLGIHIPGGTLTQYDDPDAPDNTETKLTLKNSDGTWTNVGSVMCDLTSKGIKRNVPSDGTAGLVPVSISVAGGAPKNVFMPITKGEPWPYDDGTSIRLTAEQAQILFPSETGAFTTGNAGNDYEPLYVGLTVLSNNYRGPLAAHGITVNHTSAAFNIGATGVTSIYDLPTSASNGLITLKQNCDTYEGTSCDVVISGGTECWLHDTHYPGLPAVDLSKTTTLVDYLTKNATKGTLDNWGQHYTLGTMNFVDESSSAHMTGAHYHVISF